VSERSPRVFLLPAQAGPESVRVRLGPRPEGFRFSPDGAWATFGLPGRRYSWVRDISVLGGEEAPEDRIFAPSGASGRRDTAAAAAAAMQQLDSMLRFWRDMPPLPTSDELAEAERPRPFHFGERAPEPPDVERERSLFERGAREAARRARACPADGPAALAGVGGLVVAGGALLGAGVAPSIAVPVAILAGAAAAWAARAAAVRAARRWAERSAARRAAVEWAEREERLGAAWRYEWAEWDLRRAQARVGWHGAELERIGRVRRLRAGDPAAVRRCLEATLADLDFPYEAACEVATDGETAFLVLDVPQVDSVVPAARAEVDEDLEVREVPLGEGERQAAYAEHVAGVALLVARATFAAAPGLRRVQLAGYRQGAKAAQAPVEYLVDVAFDRERVESLDPLAVDPEAHLALLPGRFARARTSELAPLPAPPWLSEAFGGDALGGARSPWKN